LLDLLEPRLLLELRDLLDLLLLLLLLRVATTAPQPFC
jgi:hypothetical protein